MKYFLIIGTLNAVTYKEIFPSIKEGKVFTGNVLKEFITPDGSIKYISNIRWFQNLEKKQVPELVLTQHYSPEKYPKYTNYDAIECSRVKDIPCDYDGVIGVTIGFVDKWNPEQFEVVGCPHADDTPSGWSGMSKEFVSLYYKQGNTGQYQPGKRLPSFITSDGRARVPFTRILIKKRG